MTVTAIRPNYDHKAKSYVAEVIENADVLLAHEGFLVYNTGNEKAILESVRTGRLVSHWKAAKVAPVIAHLETVIADQTEAADAEYVATMRRVMAG